MSTSVEQFLVFRVSSYDYGLPIQCVEKVIHAVEIVPLPETIAPLVGVFGMAGRRVPAINMRKLFCFEERQIDLYDPYLIVSSKNGLFAMIVDSVVGVTEAQPQLVSGEEMLAASDFLQATAQTSQGLLLLVDHEKIFTRCAALGHPPLRRAA